MKRTLVAILIVVGLSAAHVLWADSENSYGEVDIFDLIMGIIENPDPIPQIHYISLFVDPASPDARATGPRDDGRPAFEIDRIDLDPYVTWAFDAGKDHDIAFNAWHKNEWHRRIEFITSSTVDELDPRLYVDKHNDLYLTWWENDAGSRIMAARLDGHHWGQPQHVGTGRRPAVAVWEGDAVFAYERDASNGTGQEVVFAQSTMGTFCEFTPPVVVAATARTERLDPIVHVRDGKMWIDWIEDDGLIAFSVYQGGEWKPPVTVPWIDPSWAGELTARHEIEIQLVDP